MKQFLNKIKLVNIVDLYHLFVLFPIAYLFSLFFRNKNNNLILICESGNEARDNGYWLAKYISENDKSANLIYVINEDSCDYKKINDLGIKTVDYMSLTHWIYYLSAGINVSTQKGGKPNAAVCYLLEVYGLLDNNRLFLQHGITISNAKWLYYENTKMRGFVCGAKPEYDDIVLNYGYPEGYVKYLGFPRFDNLHNVEVKKDRILVMPSWREWLVLNTEFRKEFNEGDVFERSEYFNVWNSFLKNKELIYFIEENNLELIFYPHRNIQDKLELFEKKSTNIIFASWKEYDIQELLKNSAFLITDYSSICLDFAYMKKPALYYQFDQEKFRKGQYEKGYFDYNNDGFGKVLTEEKEVINELIKYFKVDFSLEKKYENRISNFFELYDNKNSYRNYEFVKEILMDDVRRK